MITDGPFPEAKELLAGYRVVDVDTYERAVELAGPGVGCSRPRRRADPAADRAAPGDERPRPRGVTSASTTEDLLRDLAPQVLGVVVRRYGHFDDAEDAVQEALVRGVDLLGTGACPTTPWRG